MKTPDTIKAKAKNCAEKIAYFTHGQLHVNDIWPDIEQALLDVRRETLEEIAQEVSTNAAQDILECGNADAPLSKARHEGYMECIQHTEVLLRNRIEKITLPNTPTV